MVKNKIVLRITFLYVVVICLFPLCPLHLGAQNVEVNDQGEKIVVFDDGTWRFFEARDTILEKAADRSNPQQEYNYRTFQRYVAAAVAYEAQQVRQLDSSKNTYLNLEDQIRTAESSNAPTHALQLKLDSLRRQVHEDQRLVAYSRKLIRRILKIGAKQQYAKLAKIYVPGVANTRLTDEDRVRADQLLTDHQEQSFDWNPFQKKQSVDKEVHRTNPGVKDKNLNSDERRVKDATRQADSTKSNDASKPLTQVRDTDAAGNNILAPASGQIDMAYRPDGSMVWHTQAYDNPGRYDCTYTFEGVDEFTQQQKKELKKEYIFYHTDERLKPYLKNKEYITCQGYLTSISGGFRYLNLIITIASRTARRDFGYIKASSLLNIKLLDGNTVSLFSQGDELGALNARSGDTVYKVRYPIDFQKEKLLLRSEVDKIRLIWSTGYEDYDIYNVDFFINQLKCLNSN